VTALSQNRLARASLLGSYDRANGDFRVCNFICLPADHSGSLPKIDFPGSHRSVGGFRFSDIN
jgi:hypothetical protein